MISFQPSRTDGRSDRRVVYELVQHAQPDATFTHQQIADALSEGLDEPVDRDRVYRAVSQGNRTLLRERKRYLTTVPNRGYRVIHTSEAVSVALDKKGRAETMLKRGIDVLQHARMDELDPTQRQLHEGQLLVMAGLYEATRQSERRHDRAESLIADLTNRVQTLEQGD